MPSPLVILSQAGVSRDTTVFDSNFYNEMHWCRTYNGRPRKMGGYTRRSSLADGIVRQIGVASKAGLAYVHLGSQDVLQRLTIDNITGVTSAPISRTPVGFAGDPNNLWQFASLYDGGGNAVFQLAHAAPNLMDINNDVATPVYYGDEFASVPLTAVASSSVSGGICASYPYLFAYGSDGQVKWCVA